MDYQELVSSLECDAVEHRETRTGELLAQAAEAITTLHNHASALESDVEDLLQEIAAIKAARLRVMQ